MGYLPELDVDVFISYATSDDDKIGAEPRGWVACLDEDLRKRLVARLGFKGVSVWRDSDIHENEAHEEKILKRLAKAATLVSIISPSFFSSSWCLRELETFAEFAERTFGLRLDAEKSRILKVEKLEIPVDRKALPEPFQGFKSYKFYAPDPDNPRRFHDFRPLINPEDNYAYFKRLDDLAQDIAAVLKTMAQKANGTTASAEAPAAVYVAETTADLDEEADQIRRELKDRGYTVLPAGDLPYRAKDFKQKVKELMDHCVLSVHLIGREYGFIPEGESEKSNEWLQSDLALDRARDSEFRRVIWMPPGLETSDPRQQRFLTYLREDTSVQTDADVLETSIEDLKTAVVENLKKVVDSRKKKASQPQLDACDELTRIYVICDQLDLGSESLEAMHRYLFDRGYECILPSADDDESEAPKHHQENLELCDAFLIFYGAGSDRWFQAMLRDFRTFLSRRQRPVLAKAAYVAPPQTAAKDRLLTHEAIVLRGAETFAPEALAPFVSKLAQGKART